MVKTLRNRTNGQFAGSIGNGKNKVPTASNNPLARLFNKINPPALPPTREGELSYCETYYAGSDTPRHIRIVGSAGLKLTGGADTPTLCGLPVNALGWDLRLVQNAAEVETSMNSKWAPGSTCKKCGAEAIRILASK